MANQKREIKRVVVLANQRKMEGQEIIEEIKTYLEKRQIPFDLNLTFASFKEITLHRDTNLAICLGGDGTVLSCARLLHAHGIPMLAVNFGTFGFITEICKSEWREAFELYEANQAPVSRRLMLRVSVTRKGEKVFLDHGLNETTLSATGISKMVSLDLFINSTHTGKIRSDGIIVATPTGSTAYSLAAGGPILDVNLDALIINPVCPFTLSNRPLVVDGEDVVMIRVGERQKTQVSLTIDGQVHFALEEGDEVTIEKARSKALIIASPQRNYYEVIRDKLNWSGGMHA
jgi:NAD+ kinase